MLVVLQVAASLLHFTHNAVYLRDYPNLPAWITSREVWLAWFAATSVGVAGYWLYRWVSRSGGLAILALYALLGFAGLDHYAVARMDAHTLMMNFSILFEVATAAALLGFVASSALIVLSRPR